MEYINVSVEELYPFLHGCSGFIDTNGKKTPVRFPPEQLGYLKSANERFYDIARCTAGIYLEFSTDSPEISFDYSIDDAVYVITSGVDIYENGLFAAHYAVKAGDTDIHISYKRSCNQASDIKIFFPSGVIFSPFNFSIGNAVKTKRKDKLALFYGSSSTQSAYTPHPSLSWPVAVSEFLNCECVNRGIGSYYYDENILSYTISCNPDYVFSMYGGNDIYLFPSVESALDEADKFLSRLGKEYSSSKIYVLSPEYMRKKPLKKNILDKLAAYCAALPDICDKYGFTYISTSPLIADLPELFLEDNIHFTQAGMGMFSVNLINTLKDL